MPSGRDRSYSGWQSASTNGSALDYEAASLAVPARTGHRASSDVRFVLTRVVEASADACDEEWRFGSVLLDAGALSSALKRLANDLQATFVYRRRALARRVHARRALRRRRGARADQPAVQTSAGRAAAPLHATPSGRYGSACCPSLNANSCCWRPRPAISPVRRITCGGARRGVIGSLTQLLTEATAETIDTGAERITHKLLDAIDVGYAAEVGAGRQQPPAPGRVTFPWCST